MEKIPYEIDELLWAAAESQDATVENEFVSRYPHLRANLATRKAMLDVLRAARPAHVAARSFRPPVTNTMRWWIAPVAAALLASLAFGAYEATRALAPRVVQPPTTQPLDVQLPNTLPPKKSPDVVQTPTWGSTRQGDIGTSPRPITPTTVATVKVRAGQVGLLSLFDQIRAQGKIQVEVMPGIEDIKLALKPNRAGGILEQSPLEWLRMLEQVAPIHVVDGGPDGFLILPIDKVNNVETPSIEPPPKKEAKPGN